MSTETTTVKTVEAPAAATEPKAKTVKKKTAPKAKTEPKTDARKVSGLRRFQIRALKALSESKDQLTVAGIAKRAKISHTMVVMGLGTLDSKLLKAHDKKMGFPSLLTLGHCKVVEIEGIIALQLTASGKKALTLELAKVDGKLPKVKSAPVAA